MDPFVDRDGCARPVTINGVRYKARTADVCPVRGAPPAGDAPTILGKPSTGYRRGDRIV